MTTQTKVNKRTNRAYEIYIPQVLKDGDTEYRISQRVKSLGSTIIMSYVESDSKPNLFYVVTERAVLAGKGEDYRMVVDCGCDSKHYIVVDTSETADPFAFCKHIDTHVAVQREMYQAANREWAMRQRRADVAVAQAQDYQDLFGLQEDAA